MKEPNAEKTSLLLYLDWLETLELLEPRDRGILFSNLLRSIKAIATAA